MPLMKDPVKIERNCWRIYGCSLEDALRLNADQPLRLARSPAMRFYDQKKAADKRGIEWELTFPQWLSIWQGSGKFEQRGRGNGYVMGRNGDVGPYAAGNVYICTAGQNSKDGYLKVPAAERAAKRAMNPDAKKRLGSGRGWTYIEKCTTNPYQVMVGSDRLGSFPTVEEARAAYVEECDRRLSLLKESVLAE